MSTLDTRICGEHTVGKAQNAGGKTAATSSVKSMQLLHGGPNPSCRNPIMLSPLWSLDFYVSILVSKDLQRTGAKKDSERVFPSINGITFTCVSKPGRITWIYMRSTPEFKY